MRGIAEFEPLFLMTEENQFPKRVKNPSVMSSVSSKSCLW
jgi:hypothetical protein